MSLFKIDNCKLEKVKTLPFDNEHELQKITEDSLKEVFGLEFIKSQFSIGHFKMDTLAFDIETKSFVIIEFKNLQAFSIIDQGFAYLWALNSHKEKTFLEYTNSTGSSLKFKEVNWNQSRVIFVSPQFNNYQKEAINYKDLAFELWEVTKFSNDTILFNQLKSPSKNESIKDILSNIKIVKKVSKEIRVFIEEDHLKYKPTETIELYKALKERILSINGNIKLIPRQQYIGFKAGTNFVDVHIQKNKLKLWINMSKGELDDPKKLAKDVSEVGHWGNGDYEVLVNSSSDLDYLLTLIKQSYLKHS